jgi:hypothetical protein
MFKWIFRAAVAAFVLIIVVPLTCAVLTLKVPPPSHTDEPDQPAVEPASAPAPSEDEILVGATMEGVKKFLDDPDSATFPPVEQWSRATLPASHFRLLGEVSVKNAFGGRVRDAVAAELVDDGQQVKIVYLKIGGKIVLDVR